MRAATPTWLDQVAPILTSAQKKLYLSLPPEARANFEDEFWADQSITSAEYFRRLQHIDAAFGSDRPGSGANTDPGRVYLSLGPPNRVTRIPSSRIFVPLEIWYYADAPGIELNTELRLIFYQKNTIGFLKLYSPAIDTIRALLLPEAATAGMFGPNADITESSIRQTLKVGPAEDEVISAAVNVATGIKYSGNDQILGQIASPLHMLGKPSRTAVRSRFIVARPNLDVLQTVSPYGGFQVDLRLKTTAHRELDLRVYEGAAAVYQNQLRLKFSAPQSVHYTHRLDLLPGSYRALFMVDGTSYVYPLEVKVSAGMSEILRADYNGDVVGRQTPFEFDGKQLELNAGGRLAFVAVEQPGKVTWMVHKGAAVVWRSQSEARDISVIELPADLPAGAYKLEAVSHSDARSTDLVVGDRSEPAQPATLVSFNANLSPALRLAFVGHQWLLRGDAERAARSLQTSLGRAPTLEALIEMARLDASQGHYDEARNRARAVLSTRPNDFEALSVLAYVEAQLQDYPIAAELYRRALAVQDSAEIRLALAQLPQR